MHRKQKRNLQCNTSLSVTPCITHHSKTWRPRTTIIVFVHKIVWVGGLGWAEVGNAPAGINWVHPFAVSGEPGWLRAGLYPEIWLLPPCGLSLCRRLAFASSVVWVPSSQRISPSVQASAWLAFANVPLARHRFSVGGDCRESGYLDSWGNMVQHYCTTSEAHSPSFSVKRLIVSVVSRLDAFQWYWQSQM